MQTHNHWNIRELSGWIGVLLILIAYTLGVLGLLAPDNLLYSLMNVTGAAGIIISSYRKRDFQPIFLNTVWLIVAMIGIIKSIF